MITSTIVTENGETVITIKCGSYYRVERTGRSFFVVEGPATMKTFEEQKHDIDKKDAENYPQIIMDEKNRADIEACLDKSREEDARKARVVQARKTLRTLGKK